jgi:hypothetical protein
MNMPQLEADLADMRRKELEDWAQRERLARAAMRGQPSLLSRWMMQLSKFALKSAKPARKRTRKMNKAIPMVR